MLRNQRRSSEHFWNFLHPITVFSGISVHDRKKTKGRAMYRACLRQNTFPVTPRTQSSEWEELGLLYEVFRKGHELLIDGGQMEAFGNYGGQYLIFCDGTAPFHCNRSIMIIVPSGSWSMARCSSFTMPFWLWSAKREKAKFCTGVGIHQPPRWTREATKRWGWSVCLSADLRTAFGKWVQFYSGV